MGKIPLLSNILFNCIKRNNIINNFLMAVDKFIPEMFLRQPGFNYSACGPFTKNHNRIKKFKEARDSRSYGDLKYLVEKRSV